MKGNSSEGNNLIKIRKATRKDLKCLINIALISFREVSKRLDFPAIINNQRYKIFVADVNDKSIGYIVVSLLSSEEPAELLSIAVDRRFQNEGIGTHLIKHLIEFLKTEGINLLRLEVAKNNYFAKNLYTKFRFVNVGIRKNYYHDPEDDAVLLEMEI
tara:strand:+ start:61 stop:534 length:474 start_codon:yes stop_codon:yes gene_type:complete